MTEMFSKLLTLCDGNPRVTGLEDSTHKWAELLCIDVYYAVSLN